MGRAKMGHIWCVVLFDKVTKLSSLGEHTVLLLSVLPSSKVVLLSILEIRRLNAHLKSPEKIHIGKQIPMKLIKDGENICRMSLGIKAAAERVLMDSHLLMILTCGEID
ncbi:hypothetical protein AVEN_201769-1 [Araneus ventricosus]|uniref:Uncharacterized protein n=1 Tax=Araneus ventricosus TaxID=182803 RepID=A0A4Y2KZR7_ARAVE|nr:hypothetical protein AVEN_201769-1 [Araneus ventricosus]